MRRVGMFLVVAGLIVGMVGCPVSDYDLNISSSEGGEVIQPGEEMFSYSRGEVVDLVATPAVGYRFAGWTGDVDTIADVEAAETTITMNGEYTITANFVAVYELTIASTLGGSVTDPGEGTFAYDTGTEVSLTVAPDAGCHFVFWTGDVDAIADVRAGEITIVVEGDCSITANFFQGELITDWYDLDAVRHNLGGSYLLANDLDATSAGYEELAGPMANDGKGWQPIGYGDYDYQHQQWVGEPFEGTLHGRRYEIRDMFINRLDEKWVGLFGCVGEGGVIQDVGVVDAAMSGDVFVGALAGRNYATVSNSYSDGSVTGTSNVGGLVGYNRDGAVSNSHSTANVTGTSLSVGGLVGVNADGTVSDCYATGSVTGTTSVGGLVAVNMGHLAESATVRDSYATGRVEGDRVVGGLVGQNMGTVRSSRSAGNVAGSESVGALVGVNNFGIVSDSYSTGSATGDHHVGGLVAYNRLSTVSGSHATGDVIGGENVGGLIGYNEMSSVSDSYYSGRVTGGGNVGGLVGWNAEGSVNNCHAGDNVTGQKNVGGLVGWNQEGLVSNSHSTGTVTGAAAHVGGLVGHNLYGTVTDSHSTAGVSGDYLYVGGLVGANYHRGATDPGAVSNCYATGDVTGYTGVGGLVGYSWEGILTNCYATGSVTGNYSFVGGLVGGTGGCTVTRSYSVGSVNGGEQYAGGLVGANHHGTVTESYATGSVTGDEYVGGLAGKNWGGTLADCYATGSVSGEDRVGGLVGWQCNGASVSRSYSIGNVTGEENVGGLIGRSDDSSVSNSFWDTQTSEQAASDGGTGKTTAEMQDIRTFNDLDWSQGLHDQWSIIGVADETSRDTGSIWNVVDGQTYPFLSWQ